MNIDEYIKKRKSEDGINEFDLENRTDNLRIVVNYVFEYFNNYLDTIPEQERSMLKDDRIVHYKKRLTNYSNEIQNWLVSMYIKSGHYVNNMIQRRINDPNFMLYNTDAEYRALSYEVYSSLKSDLRDINFEAEMIYNFLKEYHRVISLFHSYDKGYFVTDEINAWIADTYEKYGVNLYNFCYERLESWSNNPYMWPKGQRIKSKYYDKYKGTDTERTDPDLLWEYNYKKNSNLFGIDDFYRNLPKKKFLSHRKKDLEILMMYIWTRNFEIDPEYWSEYIDRALV